MKNKGFTLVELLVVIVIIGILAAAAISVFGGGTDKAKVSTLKSDVSTMQSAGSLGLADGGWLATRDINALVSEGYLSAVPINPYATSTNYFYAYGASQVTGGQLDLNPIVYSAGLFPADVDTGDVYEKGGAISMDSLGTWSGGPASGTADSWTTTIPS